MKFQKDIKFIFTKKIFEELKECVNNASPNEACGLIFGEIKEIKLNNNKGYRYYYLAKKFKCFESDRKSPVAFLINNFEEFNRVFKEAAEEYKLKLISIFHSHPAGTNPSGVDLNNMKFLDNCGLERYKYLIWIIMDSKYKKLDGFIYLDKKLSQIAVEINKK